MDIVSVSVLTLFFYLSQVIFTVANIRTFKMLNCCNCLDFAYSILG